MHMTGKSQIEMLKSGVHKYIVCKYNYLGRYMPFSKTHTDILLCVLLSYTLFYHCIDLIFLFNLFFFFISLFLAAVHYDYRSLSFSFSAIFSLAVSETLDDKH